MRITPRTPILLRWFVVITLVALGSTLAAQRTSQGRHVQGREPVRMKLRDLPRMQRPTTPPARTRGASTSDNFGAIIDDGSALPPNTHGAVGPSHLVATTDAAYRVQMHDGTEVSTIAINDFWMPLGALTTAFNSRVLYDDGSGRFMVCAVTDARMMTSALLFAVSDTGDPTGNWSLYRINVSDDSVDPFWIDTPTIGFNGTWITINASLFDDPAGAFQRANIYAIDKAGVYAGDPIEYTIFEDANAGNAVPALTYDATEANQYLVQTADAATGELRIWTIDGTVSNEVLTEGSLVAAASPWQASVAGMADFAPQMGVADLIQTGDDRMQNVVFRNGSLWACHTVHLPDTGMIDRSAIQWFELTPDTSGMMPAMTIAQEGRIDDATAMVFRAFPSIAVNSDSDVLIGYSRFSADNFPSAAYSFRWSNDTAGLMQSEVIYTAGEASYFKQDANLFNAWGNYSATVADPTSTLNFWTIQEYASTPDMSGDLWGTGWANVTVANELPSFTSTPITQVSRDSQYSYTVVATDTDHLANQLAFTATTIPAWLMLNDNGDGTATLSGTPSVGDNGMHSVVIEVSDSKDMVEQSFMIEVIGSPELLVQQPLGTPLNSAGTLTLSGTVQSGTPAYVSFYLENQGDEPLLLTGMPATVEITSMVNCNVALSHSPGDSIQPQGTDFITFTVTPANGGAFSFSFSLPNNDADEGNFSYNVNGTAGTRASLRVSIEGGGAVLPGAANTNPAPALRAGSAAGLSLRLSNTGNGLLQFSNDPPVTLSFSSNCAVSIIQPDAFVPAGGWRLLKMSVTASTNGDYSFVLRIRSNDPDNVDSYYRFASSAAATGTGALRVERIPGIALAESAALDVGQVRTNAGRTLEFSLRNTGSAALALAGQPSATLSTNCEVSVTALSSLTILPGQSRALSVEVSPLADGAFSFTLNVAGAGTVYAMAISGDATSTLDPIIALYAPDGSELMNASSMTAPGADINASVLLRYVVENKGGQDLNLMLPVAISNVANATVEMVYGPSAVVAAFGGISDFVIRVTPLNAGVVSFQFRVLSDDATQSSINVSVSLDAAEPDLVVWRNETLPVAADGSWEVPRAAGNEEEFSLSGRVANQGNGTLTLTGVPAIESEVGVNVSFDVAPNLSVAPTGWSNFTLTITPDTTDATTAWSFDLVFASDDPDTPSYRVTLSRVDAPVPSASVRKKSDDSSCALSEGGSSFAWMLLLLAGLAVSAVRRDPR